MGEPVVELRQASLTYPGPTPVEVLKNVDLAIGSGEYATVVGRSGAGKSSFLNIVGLMDTLTSGSYLLNGLSVDDLSDGDRATIRGHSVGFVFQAFHLMNHRSSTENVEMALLYSGTPRRQRVARAREALRSVGLEHRMDALPSTLSGGERQRVAIARAIASEPALLLCDEPTGNLDSQTASDVLALIDDIHAAGQTVIVITHDAEVAARGQRQLTIVDGQVLESHSSSRVIK